MERKRAYLGVDCGGSKCDLLLAGSEGEELRRISSEGVNAATIGPEQAAACIAEAVLALLGGMPMPDAAYFGVAGAGSGDNAERIEKALSKALPGVLLKVESDGRCIIEAAEVDGPCIAVIMGTGSAAFAFDGERLHRFGGWGWLFDGAGSGFDLGRDAISLRLAFEDGMAENSALVEAVGRRLGRPAFGCIRELQQGDRSAIAAFAPLVFEAVDAGDSQARVILEKSLAHTAMLVRAAGRAFPKSAEGPLVLGGGLCARRDIVGPMLKKLLSPESPEMIFPRKAPVWGAVRAAEKLHLAASER